MLGQGFLRTVLQPAAGVAQQQTLDQVLEEYWATNRPGLVDYLFKNMASIPEENRIAIQNFFDSKVGDLSDYEAFVQIFQGTPEAYPNDWQMSIIRVARNFYPRTWAWARKHLAQFDPGSYLRIYGKYLQTIQANPEIFEPQRADVQYILNEGNPNWLTQAPLEDIINYSMLIAPSRETNDMVWKRWTAEDLNGWINSNVAILNTLEPEAKSLNIESIKNWISENLPDNFLETADVDSARNFLSTFAPGTLDIQTASLGPGGAGKLIGISIIGLIAILGLRALFGRRRAAA